MVAVLQRRTHSGVMLLRLGLPVLFTLVVLAGDLEEDGHVTYFAVKATATADSA